MGSIEMKSLLTADVGGTNSRFAHFESDRNGVLTLVSTKWLPTSGAGSFFQLLKKMQHTDFTLSLSDADIAIIAAAGPVAHERYCAPPYISWDIDLTRKNVKAMLPNAYLINDFIAQAWACRSPIGKSARSILPGEMQPDGAIGILGAGTALGKAILVPVSENDFVAFPSEGGHTPYPFVSQQEWAFREFYQQKSGLEQITGNLVVSGRGLRYLHWFLTGEEIEPQEIAARFDREPQTLAWFARFYGRACRDFALEMLASGGLYITGGVAARNSEILFHENFRNEFLDSPTMGDLLAKIPVFLNDNQESGLWGAALYGQKILQRAEQGATEAGRLNESKSRHVYI
jgi:glucokinase